MARNYGALGFLTTVSVAILATLYFFAADPMADAYALEGRARSILLASPFVLIGVCLVLGISLVWFDGWRRQLGWGLVFGIVIPASPWIAVLALWFWPVAAVLILIGIVALLWRRSLRDVS
ncbi:hypothetical protein QSJ18_19555 [Gordonia sp. ABSL1-1]|uniref:hypothetical protein n=1 Tax=Gordonia sp. ABSL1-1 TaxID=3053923 RepID=UPI0025724677|nr:hypothetical protein [Gordonia sp. ABSL1-1]MDL9938947.1 hypothetical protein [Gordonia sp. ABSL1-1]